MAKCFDDAYQLQQQAIAMVVGHDSFYACALHSYRSYEGEVFAMELEEVENVFQLEQTLSQVNLHFLCQTF
jgi:hypothetical protein